MFNYSQGESGSKLDSKAIIFTFFCKTHNKEMMFCYQNCSDLLWEKIDREKLLKFKAEGREFENCLRSLEQFIQTVKGQNNFW